MWWLALSLAIMVALSLAGLRTWACVLVALLTFGLLALGPLSLCDVLIAGLSNIWTWDLTISVGLIAILGALMRELSQIEDITEGLRGLGLRGRPLMATGSILFGLLPVPGGAVLSASLVEEESKCEESLRGPATANLLFRHLNFFAYPFSPALMFLAGPALLNMSVFMVVLALLPISALHIIVSYSASFARTSRISQCKESEAKAGPERRKEAVVRLVRGLAPILVAPIAKAILSAVGAPDLGFSLFVCISIALSLALAWRREGLSSSAMRALRGSRAYNIAAPVLLAMLFRDAFKASGTPTELGAVFSSLPLPEITSYTLLCWVLGLATGSALLPMTILPTGLSTAEVLMAYSGAVVGYIISPLHLCFIVTAEYFELRQVEMYPRLAAYAASMLVASPLLIWAYAPLL